MPPFRTSVVRLVSYRREEYLDRHPPHAPAANERPFLFLLSPDTLQLVTASDAPDSPPAVSTLLQQVSLKPADRPPRRPAVRPLALLHKLAHSGQPAGEGTPRDAPAGAEDSSAQWLGEELEEGQFMTFSIALSQIAGVEIQEGRHIKILFCRQRPHRSTEANDDWKSVMKAMAFPVVYPVEGWKHRNFSVRRFMHRHYRDPFVSSVVLEADTPQDAARLHQAIEDAIARLGQAVQWLAQDLPLDSRPVVTLVTATVAEAPGGEEGGKRSAGQEAHGAPAQALGLDAGQQQIICPFPQLQQPLDVPWPAAAPGAGGGGGAAAPAACLAINIWLHSPLGPAVATISEEQLRQSAAEGGAPVCVVATLHGSDHSVQDAAAAPPGAAGRDRLEVILQFTATRRPAPAGRSSLGAPQPPTGAGTAGGAVAASGGGGSLPAMLAVLAVPLLAAWLQLLADTGAPAIRVLQSVAFLVSCLAALAAIVVLQLKGRPPPQQLAAQPGAALPAGWWRLVLLHADLVLESRNHGAAGAPTLQRVVSDSAMSAPPSARLPLDGSALELPPAIRRLVDEHPGILNDDIAARFLVGLGHGDKAYQGLKNMVTWVEAQGVADLVHQPQPRFEIIRQHYPQVFYCWSRSTDCVLEVECTGRWRAAFDALRAKGVTERELLRHQFFCMEYAFRQLDTRPLPQGKTVKIIDLEGLTLRDVSSAAFKWYLQVGGSLLAVSFPQRLHQAFLLNAPAWSGVIWKVLAAVIPRRTREQLQLFTKKQRAESAEALLQWVPAEQLPAAYGGRCSVPLSESQLEREMLDFVRRLNREQPQQQAGGEEPGGETGAETAAGGESTAADEALGSKLS